MKAIIIMLTITQLFIISTQASNTDSKSPSDLIKEMCSNKPDHTYINDGKFAACVPNNEVTEYLK